MPYPKTPAKEVIDKLGSRMSNFGNPQADRKNVIRSLVGFLPDWVADGYLKEDADLILIEFNLHLEQMKMGNVKWEELVADTKGVQKEIE